MNRCAKIHDALNSAINTLLKTHARPGSVLLDVGCWNGETTLTYGNSIASDRLMGIEGMPKAAAEARTRNVTVMEADIEKDDWGMDAESVDVVVCNQVFEHLKNIFIPFDQIAHTLKPDGVLIISVPNLASFHNRAMLALGLQPSSIRIWGPHVRGYAMGEFTQFCLTSGLFELVRIKGVGFYPFPPRFGGNLLAALWKSACHTPIWVLRRTAKPVESFQARYLQSGMQTLMDPKLEYTADAMT